MDSPDDNCKKKYRYPRSVGFIITNEFCERFSFYGMRTILVLYLSDKLGYSDDTSVVIYHVFTMLVYFFPIFGAMIADSWLGRFRTIFYLSIVYACGNVLLSITAMPPLHIPVSVFTMIGLLLVAVGTGGIKPCVSAFGGDQFKLPQQEKQLATFFSLFYFSINAGSFISTFITPILRMDVHCFGNNDCYSVAFGVPGCLMVISIIVFVCGKKLYVIKEPSGNVLLQVVKCISHAVSRRSKLKKQETREHWLDYADDKFDRTLIGDVKALLKVLLLFVPLPVFWALFDQQGSRWTFQATRMNGAMGSFILKPDQMQVVNPLLILAFIPLFEVAIYPALRWCKLISKPLHKMVIGGLLASVAFIISAIVELQLEKTYPILPTTGMSQMRIYNTFQCDITINNMFTEKILIKSLDKYENLNIEANGTRTYTYSIEKTECNGLSQDLTGNWTLEEKKAISLLVGLDVTSFVDESDKSSKGNPVVRVLRNFNAASSNASVRFKKIDVDKVDIIIDRGDLTRYDLSPTNYDIFIGEETLATAVTFELGGVYVMNIDERGKKPAMNIVLIAPPNSVHMMWLLPQYIVITMAEVMFSVTGLEFAFTQAPSSMKSVLTAGWLLTVAFGNLIVVIVAEAKGFDSQASEFFLFAGLMFADIIIFWLMTLRYKYVTVDSDTSSGSDLSLSDNRNEKQGLPNPTYVESEE